MSCAGTYFGGCCDAPTLRNERVVSEVSQTGFFEFDLRNRQQLYSYSDSFISWNFSNPITGQSYSGGHSWQGFFDEGSSVPRVTDGGDPIPNLDDLVLRWGYALRDVVITPTQITAILTGRFLNTGGNAGVARDIGSYMATLGSPFQLAEQVALANVLAYDPATGANPGNCRIFSYSSDIIETLFGAQLYRGTIAPYPTVPFLDPEGTHRFFVPSVTGIATPGGGGYAGLTAFAIRLLAAPDSLYLLRLRPWTFRDRDRNSQGGFPGPGNFTDCQTIDLANGADVVVSSVPDDGATDKDRIIFAGLILSRHLKTDPAPC